MFINIDDEIQHSKLAEEIENEWKPTFIDGYKITSRSFQGVMLKLYCNLKYHYGLTLEEFLTTPIDLLVDMLDCVNDKYESRKYEFDMAILKVEKEKRKMKTTRFDKYLMQKDKL